MAEYATTPQLVITDTFTTLVTDFNTVSSGLGATGDLTTNVKTTIVGAINELEVGIRGTSNNLVATDLTTSANDLVGAINEIEGVFDASAKGISAGSDAFDITTTHASGISLAAPITSLTGHLSVVDNKEIRVGTGDDLVILHDATHSIIKGDSIRIKSNSVDETMASFTKDGEVNLYHNNISRLATTATGVSIPQNLELGASSLISGGGNTAITLSNANVTVNGTLSVGSLDTSESTVRLAINELHGEVNTNTSNISTNTSAISANTSARTTNASNISTNTTNITNNDSDISTNASNISANTTAISANTTARTNNTNAIGTLGGLDSDISADGNLVVAINELQGDIRQINANGASANNTIIGTLTDLNTSTQTNIVAAINEIEGVFDASDKGISAGTDAFTIVSGDFTVNSSGDINLDADGGDIFLKDNNVTFGSLKGTSGNLIIKSGTTTALTFSGANVVPSGTIDGRDIAADGSTLDANTTKLSGIEASADVTDTASVVAALTAGTNITIASNGTISSTDTNTTYSEATSDTFGLVKVGYTENGKNYPVELAGGKMFVNVPWDIDTDTQLSTEQVQDIVGGMLGGTETGITVTYQDGTGDIDFVVASQTDNNFTTALKNKLDGIESNLNAFVEPSQALTTTATTVADAINELKAAIPLVFNASGTQLN